MTLHTSNSITDESGVVYVAEDLAPGEQELEETEDLTVKVLPFVEAYRWALAGRITDAISLAAIFRLAAERSGAREPRGAAEHGSAMDERGAAERRGGSDDRT
jgi:hypothetical protein